MKPWRKVGLLFSGGRRDGLAKAECRTPPGRVHAASNISFTSTEKPGRLGESARSPG